MQTRRARAAEKAFVSLYRELYVAPDPVPALTLAVAECASRFSLIGRLLTALRLCSAVHRTAASNERIQQLEAEVASLDEELTKLNNQDITIRNLESRILSMEDDIEQQVQQRVKVKEVRPLPGFSIGCGAC